MKKSIIFIGMAMLCLFLKGYGQGLPTQNIKPLAIGDKVPEIVFEKILNGNKQPISLSSLKGKAVILDFWATWCSSCISAFPKMYGYQKNYAKNLQIILVGDAETDTEDDLTSFLAKRVGSKDEIVLPVASHDKLSTALFPHQAFPHYVWIGADHRVKAITSSSMVSKENLENFIAGRDVYVKTKEY